ncbi:hypothetical protein [Actinacidiphila acidipaludis]|uniref:Uncharacterized protein n=1 Tax=Actinacidiphila acidipaludis TaxID=2873382 RepID=A0ABS7QIP7_9ACTN|nr:hypothetical protein [Streptomyces acidipaludis]MBY8881654.1 hypothetical protein [Streptomyces acidipaludis]
MRLHHGIDVERMRAFADAVFSISQDANAASRRWLRRLLDQSWRTPC